MSLLIHVLQGYIISEVGFGLYFYFWALPRAKVRTQPHAYRDYGRHRHKLLIRILNRMKRTCLYTGTPFYPEFESFVKRWFHLPNQNNATQDVSSNSSSSVFLLPKTPLASDGKDSILPEENSHKASSDRFPIKKDDMVDFMSWAFFGKHAHELDEWEENEAAKNFQILNDQFSIRFEAGRTGSGVKPRRLTLDQFQPLPRPLFVYGVVALIELTARAYLKYYGFTRYTTTNGLRYWYRPRQDSEPSSCQQQLNHQLPLLFFHGIAPAGISAYIPMVLKCLCRNQRSRAVFLFENPAVSYAMCFQPMDETSTVKGVIEAVDTHDGCDTHFALCGHSFGSCQVTWMLHAAPSRIKQIVLLDPVTLMLSNPDVMVNFLYKHQNQARRTVKDTVIYLMASTEICIEHYLRRHFSWYNSELWLDDIPDHVRVLVCIAGKDTIVNANSVKQEILIHNEEMKPRGSFPKIELLHWPNAGHGYCVVNSIPWNQIIQAME